MKLHGRLCITLLYAVFRVSNNQSSIKLHYANGFLPADGKEFIVSRAGLLENPPGMCRVGLNEAKAEAAPKLPVPCGL